ncbi:MAG TPA: hypothetical protein VKG80_10470 [Trebonia sp.]|nr:hypothetical protein [Trebonia sp.]
MSRSAASSAVTGLKPSVRCGFSIIRTDGCHEAWVITDSGTIAGFAVAARKSPGGAEILWIAVDAARLAALRPTR